jgi:choline-phosphate cytidylyltransferase
MWYFLGVASTTCRIAGLGDMSKETHRYTRKALLLVIFLRGIPAAFMIINGASDFGINMQDVICDGLFMGVVTSDLIVAKMAGRELHVWIVVMAAAVVVPHLQFVTFCMAVFYYASILTDLMVYFNLPFLTTAKNVYCDGVYDLCHIGHKNLFQAALKFGNRLFVGVCNDEDCAKYKRPPIMSAREREIEVANCKGVTKVIQNAPTFGLTEEFIKKHQIHVVAMGQEYIDRYPDPKDDPYYRYPREIGIARPLPRTLCLSTTELIKRVQKGVQLEKNSPT